MARPLAVLLLACLAACSVSNASRYDPESTAPTFSGSLPMYAAAAANAAADGVPDETTLPVGVGFTTGPSTFLIAGALDFVLDKRITVGPALQYGLDDDLSLVSLTGRIKYFLDVGEKPRDSFAVQPFLTGGLGVAAIDKDGQNSDSGAVIELGAGVRYLTGDNYFLGSEARLSLMPDELGGEHAFMSFELIQVVISF